MRKFILACILSVLCACPAFADYMTGGGSGGGGGTATTLQSVGANYIHLNSDVVGLDIKDKTGNVNSMQEWHAGDGTLLGYVQGNFGIAGIHFDYASLLQLDAGITTINDQANDSTKLEVDGKTGGASTTEIFKVFDAPAGTGIFSVAPQGCNITLPVDGIGLTINGYSAQTADLFEIKSSGGNVLVKANSVGNVTISTPLSDTTALEVDGKTGGSANILAVVNQPGGTNLLTVSAGGVVINTNLNTFGQVAFVGSSLQSYATFTFSDSTKTVSFKESGAGADVTGTYTIGGGGSVTIATTAVDANSFIVFSPTSADTVVPHENSGARVNGTSFQIDGTAGGTGRWTILKKN